MTEELLQSAYMSGVGSENASYDSWPEASIQSLAASGRGRIRSGPFGSALRHSEFVDEGIAVLGIDNAVQNRFAWGERRFITLEKYESLRRYRVFPRDVIVTIMGTTGRAAVIPDDIPEAITTKHLATISLNPKKAEAEYLANALHREPRVLAQIAARNRGAIMSGLNLGLIKELVVRVPPLDLQRRFAQLVGRIRVHEQWAWAQCGHADDLFHALVQRAFRGEL
jgi:type I restriction enzyme S subunit